MDLLTNHGKSNKKTPNMILDITKNEINGKFKKINN